MTQGVGGHPQLSVPRLPADALWEEGKAALEQLLKFMVHPAISSINLTAALGSLATIARQRPMFMAEVIQAYETLHGKTPPRRVSLSPRGNGASLQPGFGEGGAHTHPIPPAPISPEVPSFPPTHHRQ